MSWQWHEGCHYVSFVMYITGAKFKEHCFNISRDILDWVLNCFSGTTYDVITYNTKTWISLKRKKVFQKGKRHSSLLWKAFQISSNYFLLHRHFKDFAYIAQGWEGQNAYRMISISFIGKLVLYVKTGVLQSSSKSSKFLIKWQHWKEFRRQCMMK